VSPAVGAEVIVTVRVLASDSDTPLHGPCTCTIEDCAFTRVLAPKIESVNPKTQSKAIKDLILFNVDTLLKEKGKKEERLRTLTVMD
jgi:hypothetical protein